MIDPPPPRTVWYLLAAVFAYTLCELYLRGAWRDVGRVVCGGLGLWAAFGLWARKNL